MQNNEARGGNWTGNTSSATTEQSAQHELRLLERGARRLLAVHRDRQVPADPEPSVVVRVVRPGHLAAQRSADARLRRSLPAVLAVLPARQPGRELRSVAIRPERRRRGSTSRRLVNGTRVGFDPVTTGQTVNPIYIGAFVPGTGDPANGMVLQTDAGVPAGFRKIARAADRSRGSGSRGTSPAPARPSCTRAPASSTTRASAADRSATSRPTRRSSTTRSSSTARSATLFVAGRDAGESPGHRRSARDRTTRRRARTTGRSGCGARSAGARSVDATYTGYVGRNMEMYYDLNAVPDGARYLDSASGEPRSDGSATTALPAEFLRPYPRLSEHPRPRQLGNGRLLTRCRCR